MLEVHLLVSHWLVHQADADNKRRMSQQHLCKLLGFAWNDEHQQKRLSTLYEQLEKKQQ